MRTYIRHNANLQQHKSISDILLACNKHNPNLHYNKCQFTLDLIPTYNRPNISLYHYKIYNGY